jgi:hypothetical protein
MPHPCLSAYTETACANPDRGQSLGFSGFEYLLEPMMDASPRVVIQKAAQVGATVMAILRAVWFLDQHQAHTMYLFPTHRSAARFSRGRFQVLLEQSPYLRELFRRVKNAAHLRAGPANFYCHGARSRVELMSTPVQYLTLDERDELYLGAVTSPQPWSAVELARQRLAGQREFWELNLSTPTIPGHGVAAEFELSDQRFLYILCPHCTQWVHPTWPHGLGVYRGQPAFCCPRCAAFWTAHQRRRAIREGRWIPTYPERALRGYHLSQMISPVATADRLLEQWRASMKSPQGRQVFFNSVLGLPYVAEGARLETEHLRAAVTRGGYAMAHASHGSIMGVDVGPTWFHIVIAEPAGELLRLIWVGKVSDWLELTRLIARYRVQLFVIDAMPETHQARALAQQHPGGFLCYYAGNAPPGPAAVSPQDHILRVSRTESLDAMYLRWRLGKVAAPAELPAEFVEQMQALIRVVQVGRDGQARADYLTAGHADHFAHAMNYCELATRLRGPALRFEVTGPGVLN